jgi:hypothetical protein
MSKSGVELSHTGYAHNIKSASSLVCYKMLHELPSNSAARLLAMSDGPIESSDFEPVSMTGGFVIDYTKDPTFLTSLESLKRDVSCALTE